MAHEIILVLVTCPENESESLATAVVESGLAACVNIVPKVTSVYVWEGKVCKEPETLLVMKSNRSHFERLQERVKELHSYAVPEIIAIAVDAGYKPYIDWVNASLVQGQ